MGIFQWLRQAVRRAFVEGIQDGIQDVTSANAPEVEPVQPVNLRIAFRSEEAPPPVKRKPSQSA